MLKKLLMLCAAGTLVLGAATFAADKAEAEKAIAAAKAAQEAAAAAGGEWRDTGKMMDKAEKALAAKKYDDAVKMAGKAQFQYETGKAQMEAQTEVGNPSYL